MDTSVPELLHIVINKAATESGSSANRCRCVTPLDLHTKTVSIMEESVPLICIDAPISPGHGSDAEQMSPASRMAAAMG